MKPTKEAYTNLDKAYSHFNKVLFADALPPCIITLQRKKGARGYFWGDTWGERSAEGVGQLTDEIALNPDTFIDRTDKEILSTLVHEMCHLQQHHTGKPTRNGYHNKEWADMMQAVGLIASNTGAEGGKRTGQNMTHYIEQGGVFEKSCTALFKKGVSITWQSLTGGNEKLAKKKRASKTKYTCPSCDLNAWGKEGLNIKCGDCDEVLQPEEQ